MENAFIPLRLIRLFSFTLNHGCLFLMLLVLMLLGIPALEHKHGVSIVFVIQRLCLPQGEAVSTPGPDAERDKTKCLLDATMVVPLKRAEPLNPLIVEVARKHGMDPDLVKAMVMAESTFDPKALSSQGAAGLLQLMPETAKHLGVQDCFDPEENLDGGIRYFKGLLVALGNDLSKALAAYNAGIGRVKKYGGIPPFKDTQDYVEKVMTYYEYFQAAGKNQSAEG